MMIPTLPESAPFSPAQRAWLNGFFAGLVNVSADPNQATTVSGAPTSMTGAAPVVEEETFPWHDASLPMGERMELAKDKPVERKMMAAMAQLDCGACGYVCQTYSEAIARGEEKNLTLCTPGGKETASKLKELVQLGIKVAPAGGGAKPQAAAGASARHDRKNPFAARLIASKPLNKGGSDKDTRHVVLDLKGSTLSYKPGDALGVWPENCHELVQEILELLHASGAEDVTTPAGDHTSLREALLRDYVVTQPTEELFKLFGESEAENVAVIDLLRKHADKRIEPAAFVGALSALQPRLYSISSSLLAHPSQVHLTVGVVRYRSAAGTACKGIASTYLSDGLRPGQKARVFVHASAKFALPAEGETPMIMVGPGTGIAPFRAFLAERDAAGHKGKNWLFFGDQRQGTDFIYEEEMKSYQEKGVLTKLSTAFSRDQEKKVYVQHRMLEQAKEIFEWLEQGAHFYVCGDAKRMANDVDNALKQIVAEQGGMTPEQASAYVANLVKANRYQRDVY